jgi:hypothetical protein
MTVGLLSIAAFSLFNRGKSQINFNTSQGGGEFPFMDLMKVSGRFLSGSGLPLTPDICDSNGWPTSFPSGITSVNYGISMPTTNERPESTAYGAGAYDLSWTGTGVASFIINGGMTVVSGSLTPSAGAGHAVVIPANPAVGNTANSCNLDFNGPHQNVRFCHVNDLASVQANPNEFHPQFMTVMRSLNCGVLRFLNWISGNQGGCITNWASRTPTTWYSYNTAPIYSSEFAGHSTASGSDLSVGLPSGGFTLVDKVRINFCLDAAVPTSHTATFTSGSQNITATGHALAVNNQVYLTGTAPSGFTATTFPITAAPTLYYVVNVVDANTIQISATKGGTAITAGANGSCTECPYLTISVNGGASTPIWNSFSVPYPQSFLSYPSSSGLHTLIYDATFGAFIDFGTGSTSVPPEVCLDLCYKLRAHPWIVTPFMAMDPVTDWLTQLAGYIQTTYQRGRAPWMIPRFETPNELWNTFGTNDTQYAIAKSQFYGWGTGQPGNYYNWIGKVGSIGGQQLANVFGGANLGVTYQWIVGMPTIPGVGNSADRLASSKFLTSDPNPVQTNTFGGTAFGRYATAGGGGSSPQNWCSHICIANYFSPLERFTCQELIDGFSYSVANAANPTAQAALANSYVDTLVSQTATVTVTSSQVNIVWTAHGLSTGNPVVFMTSPPAGFVLGTEYFVKTVVDANTITLSATNGGTVITPSGSGTPTLAFIANYNLAQNFYLFNYWKNFAAGYSVTGLCAYEGGYSPDYLSSPGGFPANASWSTSITAASAATPCVLTLAATSGNNEKTGITGNPAVVGMAVAITSVAGMTQINQSLTLNSVTFTGTTVTLTNTFSAGQAVYFSGSTLSGIGQFVPVYVMASGLSGSGFQVEAVKGSGTPLTLTKTSTVQCAVCYAVTAVSGNQITLDVDSSAFSAYTSGGTLIYIGSLNFSNALRGAGKSASNLQTYLTQDYNLFATAGGEFPSCFQLGNSAPAPGTDVWSILDDIYQPFSTSAQALAIQAYNN